MKTHLKIEVTGDNPRAVCRHLQLLISMIEPVEGEKQERLDRRYTTGSNSGHSSCEVFQDADPTGE